MENDLGEIIELLEELGVDMVRLDQEGVRKIQILFRILRSINVNQTAAGKAIGWNQPQVSFFERGKTKSLLVKHRKKLLLLLA